MPLRIPSDPDELTPAWLTDALRSTGTINDCSVASFDTESLGEGAGFLGLLARVGLKYDGPEESAPTSLIAKFPPMGEGNREVADAFRFYEREIRFYEEIADEVELRTPRRYYTAMNTEAGEYILLLEDMAPARVGDQLAACSMAEAELAVRKLAEFQATWWGSPRLEELDWMPYTNDELVIQSAEDSYGKAWGPFVEKFGHKLSVEMVKTGERLAKNIENILNHLTQPPRTIIHGDYRVDNLFFATPEGGDPLAVIDWQIASRGRGVFDVAYLLSSGVRAYERKAKEMDILRMYHRTLTRGGEGGYDFDQCLYDYRLGVLFCLLYSEIAMGTYDLSDKRAYAMWDASLDRMVAAITDLDAGALIA
jgi:hypothetical protein